MYPTRLAMKSYRWEDWSYLSGAKAEYTGADDWSAPV
jgi:hypothetical protein